MAEDLDPTSDAARTGENADANRENLAKNAEAKLHATVQSDTGKSDPSLAPRGLADVREFSRSSNGDIWSIGKDLQGSVMVVHRGNLPSGGHETLSTVQDFLNSGPAGPQHEALVAMLSVGDDRENEEQATYLPGLI